MSYVFPPAAVSSVPVYGTTLDFPVHRIYCVGRNYAEHAQEMGSVGREAPFFFMKPADAIVPVAHDSVGYVPYPSLTHNLHHEIELVVAIGTSCKVGQSIAADEAHRYIYGYAVGLDMTRRDLQAEMKKQGRPWCIAKGFDASAPIGPIVPASQLGTADIGAGARQICLRVNGALRQSGCIDHMLWSVAQTLEQLSRAWTVQAGDLIFTGTPAGVAAVAQGDLLHGHIDGLPDLHVRIG